MVRTCISQHSVLTQNVTYAQKKKAVCSMKHFAKVFYTMCECCEGLQNTFVSYTFGSRTEYMLFKSLRSRQICSRDMSPCRPSHTGVICLNFDFFAWKCILVILCSEKSCHNSLLFDSKHNQAVCFIWENTCTWHFKCVQTFGIALCRNSF